ncbi:LamB/YcsF family protein [uncultured Georgenia sp.]|uniref:LamB/YcsF family protein n=1 Tax=uncultured Georgenia sp. TaxID=378209 RepID=UPI00261031C7|nr:LamB/YcsF family protein [uncultured Georgenia sp.]
MAAVTVNADVGESLGPVAFGTEPAFMDDVDWVNVACMWHIDAPAVMDRVVAEAVRRGLAVGAHPGLPVVGATRRLPRATADDVADLLLYQVGALEAFLRLHGATLHHIKPHGALYGVLAWEEELMRGAARVAALYGVPFVGMAGTAHEAVCREMGVPFVAELYVELDYRADGTVILQRRPLPREPADVEARLRAALTGQGIEAVDGTRLQVRFDSIGIHADIGGATAVARTVRRILDAHGVSAPRPPS